MLFSLSYAGFILIQTIVYGIETPGFATLIIFISLLGSIQLMGIGMLGEYIGRTYFEAKRRPSFIIRKIHQKSNNSRIVGRYIGLKEIKKTKLIPTNTGITGLKRAPC